MREVHSYLILVDVIPYNNVLKGVTIKWRKCSRRIALVEIAFSNRGKIKNSIAESGSDFAAPVNGV